MILKNASKRITHNLYLERWDIYKIVYEIDSETIITCRWQSQKSAEVVLRWLQKQGHKVKILSIEREEEKNDSTI